eukprot:645495-Pyramimonas_sp.AAC.1
MTHRLQPHLEEAMDWPTGSPYMSRADTPREELGSGPLREEDVPEVSHIGGPSSASHCTAEQGA